MKLKLSLIFFIALSCTPSKDTSENDWTKNGGGNKLQKIDEISLPIDYKGTVEFLRHQVLESNGISYLYVLNKSSNAIEIYNITDSRFEGRINVPKEGPYAIRDPQGFIVSSKDSIFVFPKGHIKNSILLNNRGEVNLRFDPPPLNDNIHGIINHKSVPSSPSYFSDKKFKFAVLPFFDSKDPSNINEKVLFEVEYDIDKNTISFSEKLKFPKSYHQKGWTSYHTNFSRIKTINNEWIYSWNGSDSLYLYDADYNLVKQVFAKSNFIDKIPFYTSHALGENQIKATIEAGIYLRILHDPYRNCYYRFVGHGRTFVPQNDVDVNSFASTNFSIIKLDNELNYLSETVFEKNIYDVFSSFISKEGLYLPKNNYWNDNTSEDLVNIDIFK